MKSVLDGLNPQQLKAVQHIHGPLLVLAGAGTGKTKVITARIAYMIEQGIDPSHILGVTFTNKAAREMRDRLRNIVPPEDASKVTLGTFHAFCARVLRKDISAAGNYDAHFTIADSQDQLSIVRQAAAELGISKEEVATESALTYISSCKNQHLWPDDAMFNAEQSFPAKKVLAEIYGRYQKLLELQNVVDFDDMLMLTLKIFETKNDLLEFYQKKYQYLLVDEYQDTNQTQFELLRLLAGSKPNICVVGDDDQSIYAWRGADVSNILNFPKNFPNTTEIKLEQNYRSTNKILSVANAVISGNVSRYGKSLWSANMDGENIKIVKVQSGEDEARFVVDAVMDYVKNN